jgi:hypothetical protein
MESAAAPNSGARSRSCGVVEAASSAKDTGRSGVVSEATCSALLTDFTVWYWEREESGD